MALSFPIQDFEKPGYVEVVVCLSQVDRHLDHSIAGFSSRTENLIDYDREVLLSRDSLFKTDWYSSDPSNLLFSSSNLFLIARSTTFVICGRTCIGLASSRVTSLL